MNVECGRKLIAKRRKWRIVTSVTQPLVQAALEGNKLNGHVPGWTYTLVHSRHLRGQWTIHQNLDE